MISKDLAIFFFFYIILLQTLPTNRGLFKTSIRTQPSFDGGASSDEFLKRQKLQKILQPKLGKWLQFLVSISASWLILFLRCGHFSFSSDVFVICPFSYDNYRLSLSTSLLFSANFRFKNSCQHYQRGLL